MAQLPDIPSLRVVQSELELAQTAQERRSDSANSIASLIIGFAGVISGIAINARSWWIAPGIVAAITSAGFALAVVWPRGQHQVDLMKMRLRYLGEEDTTSEIRILDTRIKNLGLNAVVVDRKYRLLQASLALLVGSVVLTPLAFMTEVVT